MTPSNNNFKKKLGLVLLVLSFIAGFFISYYLTSKEYYSYDFTQHVNELISLSFENYSLKIFISSSLVLSAISFVFILISNGKTKGIKDLHGSARWATSKEVKNMNLLDNKGLYVGGFLEGNKLHHLRDDSNTHILSFAPTRSGKGVSLILPTLNTNEEKSFFVYDIKGENHALSSGWREKAGNRIIKLELASKESNKYNPLDEIEFDSPTFIKDVQNLAEILTSSGEQRQDHFTEKAREVLTGLIIYTLEDSNREKTLYATGKLLTNPDLELEETLEKLVNTCSHEDAKLILTALKNTPDRERGSIVSTLRKTFALFVDPIIRENTSKSDFQINDLVNDDKPVTLYFIVQPNDLDRLSMLVRVFLTQVLNKLIEGMQFADGKSTQHNKHNLVLLLDEFASMKKMPIIESNLAFIAGYGVRAYLIVQDLDQIVKYYGRENGILSNCHIKVAFAPNTNTTADYLSKSLGNQTIVRTKTSSSGKTYGLHTSSSTQNEEVSRPLMTADETTRMQPLDPKRKGQEGGEIVVKVTGEYPIKGTRVLYFLNEVLSDRSKVKPATVKSNLKKQLS